ncbi:MAG: glycosyltransferase family 4 protein [Rhodospirillaceae bacterium]
MPEIIVANNMIMEHETAHVLQTCRMLEAFAAIGGAVTYLWPSYGHTVPALTRLPISLRPVACKARYGKTRYAEFLARLLPALSGLARPDSVVVTRSLGVALVGQLVAPRLVLELHRDLKAVARLAVPLLSRRIRWVGISGNLRDHLITAYGVPPAHAAACHDAVDYPVFAAAEPLPVTERPRPAADTALVHLYYGTLRPERGLSLIAVAARALPGHGFVLIGGGETEVAAARAGGLDLPNVLVLPAVAHERIPRLLRSYDSVLLPYTRGVGTHQWMSPLKLFEALASGTPAVVSRLGPIAEVVGDDHVAFIDCDRPDSLAEALTALAADPAAARRRAEAGQRLALAHHSWEQRARDIMTLAQTC